MNDTEDAVPLLAGHHPPISDSLGAAFAYAQRPAPHDVPELQRPMLSQSLLPNRH